MDCIIDVEDHGGARLVRLAGRLADAQVPDLLSVCADSAHVRELNLHHLVSVDPVGLSALQRLRERGITLVDVPTYIQMKLEALVRSASARCPGRA